MAKPNLALIPAAQGTKLYSVLPSDGSGDFDYTRGSSATRINAQGLIESVANTSSRLNYPLLDGKVVGCPHHLLEPQRTNLLTHSEDFSGYSSTNLNIISNQNISPSGVLNGTFLRPTTTNGGHQIYKNTSLTAGTNTLSVFIKAGNYSKFRLYFYDGTTAHEVYGDSLNGTIHSTNSTVKVESYGNDWYRYSVTATNASTSVGNYTIRVTNESYQDNWAANGVDGLYIFGLQFEAGSYPTSYIKSSGSATTRLAETATGSGSAATFNDSEGCLMAEISALANDGTFRSLTISDGTVTNRVMFSYLSTSNSLRAYIRNASGEVFSFTSGVTDSTTMVKTAIKYKENDFQFWVNGIKVGTDTSGTTFSSNTLDNLMFDKGDGGDKFYGKTKQVQYFDTALTDTQLEELTSWDSFSDMAEGQLYTIE